MFGAYRRSKPTSFLRECSSCEFLEVVARCSCPQCARPTLLCAPDAISCGSCKERFRVPPAVWDSVLEGAVDQVTTTGYGVEVPVEANVGEHRITGFRRRERALCPHCGTLKRARRHGRSASCSGCGEPQVAAVEGLAPEILGVLEAPRKDRDGLTFAIAVDSDPRRSTEPRSAPDVGGTLREHRKRGLRALLLILFGLELFAILFNRSAWSAATLLALAGIALSSLVAEAYCAARTEGRLERMTSARERRSRRHWARLFEGELVGRIRHAVRPTWYELEATPPGETDKVLARSTIRLTDEEHRRLGGFGAAIRVFYAPPLRLCWTSPPQPTALE